MEDLVALREALRKNPQDAKALKSLGSRYLKEGFYKQAQEQFFWATNFSPDLLPNILLDFEEEIQSKEEITGIKLALAGFLLLQGETDSAQIELEEILELDPQNIEAYNVLGKILIKQERLDEAIALLERALSLGVKDILLTETLAFAYLEKGRVGEAVSFYQELLSFQPANKNLLRVLGDLHLRQKNFSAAAKCFQDMFSEDPEVSTEVIQKLEDLLKEAPTNLYVREVLAEVYLKVLRPEPAVERLREIYQLEKEKVSEVADKLKKILKSYPDHPQVLLTLGEALTLQSNFTEAAETYHPLMAKVEFTEKVQAGYQKILEYCPSQVLARSYLAELYFHQQRIPQALQELGKIAELDPEEAEGVIQRCREIIKRHPQLLLGHLILGKAYFAKGELQRAILEAEGILAIDQKYVGAYILLGEVFLNQKLCRKAVEFLHNALSYDPYNPFIHEKYKEARGKELELEIESLKGRIAEDPWKISLHLDLAKLYLQKDAKEEAIRELQIALRDNSRAYFAHHLLGSIYKREGRFDLAFSQFSKALENTPPELPELILNITFNLGSAYEAQGSLRKAIKTYEEILSRQLDFGDLKERVRLLKETSLLALQQKHLLAVIARYNDKEIIGIWGRFARKVRTRKEELNLSFGQKHNGLGFEYFMKGMDKAAFEKFNLALELDPKNISILNNLSLALIREKKPSEAHHHLSQALSSDPDSAILHNNLGVVHYLEGDYSSSLTEFNLAVELDPHLKGAYLNRGDLHYLIGNISAALSDWKQIGAHDPLAEIAADRLLYKIP